jgi:hypothetical protein
MIMLFLCSGGTLSDEHFVRKGHCFMKTRWHTSRDSPAKCGAKHARMSTIEKVEIHKKRIIIVIRSSTQSFPRETIFSLSDLVPVSINTV